MRTLLLAPLLFGVAGCTPQSDKDLGDTAPTDACPVAVVAPATLTWTGLAFDVAATGEVSVSNDCSGTAPLTVSASVDDAHFSVAPSTLSVAPSAVETLEVTVTLSDCEAALGTLTLTTDDPASGSLSIALSATASDDMDCRPTGTYALATAGAKLLGVGPVDQAGWSLDVGDLNGDGYADVLVGAYWSDAAAADAGAAYLVLGPVSGPVSLAAADAIWTGEVAGDHAGLGVAVAGDVDGDGSPDVLIGASFAGDAGVAYLIHDAVGGGGSLGDADVLIVGEDPNDEAGLAVGAAGDVDADGYADILVGAYGNDSADSNAGAAYLLYGPLAEGTLDLGGADAKLTGEGHGDEAGAEVARAGDVDGDGLGDLLIGAPRDDDGGTDAGAAYLVLGPPAAGVSALGDAESKLVGGATVERSLLGAGDLNDDGFDDVIVGTPHEGAGTASLLFGPFAGVVDLGAADVIFAGEDTGDAVGWSPAVGDVDGDGVLDLLVGAPGAEDGGRENDQVGRSYIVYGPFAGSYDLAAAEITLLGEDEEDYAGVSNALADVDGDGLADILVGAIGDDDGANYAGAVYVFYAGDL